MKKLFTKALCLLLVVLMAASTVTPALAATYRPGAQSGPSSSYKNGMYYDNYKRVPITGDNRTDLIAMALSQLGYQEGAANGSFSGEVSGRNNYVEFSYNMGDLGLGYGGSDYPWCACFVSWCLYQSHCTDQNTWKDLGRYHVGDYKYIWKEISCSQWVRQLKGAGYYKYSKYEGGSYTPKYGDLVFFQNSGGVAHIGICLYVANGRIYTVEGNTSDASGLEANGGGVYFKNYSLSTSYINGYGVLPYKSDSSVAKIDYSGNNPTPGLYVANANKYIYATETATSHSWTMSRFTMFEVTEVCSNGRLKVIAKNSAGNTVTGYVSNNSDRVIQLSSTATDAVDTARANLQTVINQAEALRFYNYTEAQIKAIRSVYNEACTLVGNSAATEAQLNSAVATLRNEMGKTGTNPIALNNEGIFINGRNSVISAGDCFLYSNLWNNGLITVDNANIRYTLNVVFRWDVERQINVVKSISYGSGNSTPSIQLGESEWLVACHDWETGIASSDNPVEYSGTNYKVLSNLSVGDAVVLSGATALNAGTYVEPASYLKFIPKDAVKMTGENERVGNGKAVLFTPDFNQGLLTHENANVHNTLNVIAQWDDAKNAWIVAKKFAGNGAADESSNIEIVDGQVVIACHVGDTTSTAYNWNNLYAAQVGQKVIFSGISPTDGEVKLSIAANVSFVDYVGGDDQPEQTGPVNLALNKDYAVKDPGTAAHIANLTDGKYTDALDFTGGWFGFAHAGSNMNTDADGNGSVVVDLGKTYALDRFRLHLYAGSEGAAASIGHPSYVDIYLSNNGTDYVFVGSPTLNTAADAAYWAELSNPGYGARYVKFVVGSAGDPVWVFLNELEVYGTELTGGENVALTTGQQGTPVSGYEGKLTNGLTNDWYGMDTSSGSGSVVIDLGSRYQITKVLSFVSAGVNAPSSVSVSISPDGTNYVKSGELTLNADAADGYWAELNHDSVVGRYVKLEAENAAGMALISEVAVAGTVYVQSADTNIAMGKEMTFISYDGSPFTALLNDGLASNLFQYNVNNSSWFAFKNTGEDATSNVTLNSNRGLITIDLGGSFNNWNPTPNMVNVDDSLVSANMKLDAGTYEFKILYGNEWYGNGGIIMDTTRETPWVMDSSAGSCTLTISRSGMYAFTFNRDTLELSVTYIPDALYLRGSFNDWGTETVMNADENGIYTATVTLDAGSYEYKIADADYVAQWPANNATLDLRVKSEVTITLNFRTGEISTDIVELEEPVVVPTLQLAYPKLNLEADVMYNIYYSVSDMTDVVEMGLITFSERLADGTIEDALEVIPGCVYNGQHYMVHTNGIPAKNLGDMVFFRVYAKLSDGSYAYTQTAGYNATIYADDILNNTYSDPNLKRTLVALMNYGAAAQQYFSYKTDSLMNSFLTDAHQALVEDYRADMVPDLGSLDSSKVGSFARTADGFGKKYPKVSLGGAFSINYYFTPSAPIDGELKLYYWSTGDYEAAEVLTADNATGVVTMNPVDNSAEYYGVVEGIAAKRVGETIYVAGVYESNGVSYCTGVIPYSLAAYCLDRVNQGSDKIKPVASAIAVYGYYAKNYFANL